MGGVVKGAANLLGVGSSGQHATTSPYDTKQGMIGVDMGELGSSNFVQNSDGTWSKKVNFGANDTSRNALTSSILGNINPTGTAQTDAYYNMQTRLLDPQFERQQSNLDENLINRGIQVGTSQYQRAMTDLLNQQDTQRANIADNAIFQGQNYTTGQIGQANQLSSGRDANTLLGAMGANSAYDSNQAAQSQRNAEQEAYRNSRNDKILGFLGFKLKG